MVYAWAGIALSHICHLLSVLVIYRLVVRLADERHAHRIAFTAAALYIVSPAGLFLSAPYGESLFSLLNLTGFWLYSLSGSWTHGRQNLTLQQDLLVLSAGILLGLATCVRSNGLLSGAIFAYDLGATLLSRPNIKSISSLRNLVALGVSGVFVAMGIIFPQYLAYCQYCNDSQSVTAPRLWCKRSLPSIYSFVQDNYW